MNSENWQPSARNAWLALALLVPAPSLGVLAGMVFWPGRPLGQVVFALSKLWILVLPLVWWWRIERRSTPQPLQRPSPRALLEGLVSGLLIALTILAVYATWGAAWINPAVVRDLIRGIGLNSPYRFLGAALYWCLINALLEEYVWRWFVTRQCRALQGSGVAVILSALAFTLHHVVALAMFLPPAAVALAAAGIATGGIIWSGLYLRHRSIWAPYVSHVLADLAIFGIGFSLLLSGTT